MSRRTCNPRGRNHGPTPLSIGLVVLLLADQVLAQMLTGTLTGRVADSSGAGVPGVRVTAVSPALQGERSTHTGTHGDYKIAFLPPAIYKVGYQLDGFKEETRHLRLSVSRTRVSNVTMQVEAFVEAIDVKSDREAVSRTLTNASTVTAGEAEELAVERDIVSVALLAPAVANLGPGATRAVASGIDEPSVVDNAVGLSISGSMSFENLFLANGVVINDNIMGQLLPLLIEDAIQETTILTSGMSAEYGRFTGGVVSAVTKSGGDEVDGSFRLNLSKDTWRSEVPAIGTFSGSPQRTDKLNSASEDTVGGYFMKDHFWFFTAGRKRGAFVEAAQTSLTHIEYTKVDTEKRWEGKLTATPAGNHSIVVSFFEIKRRRTNTGFGTFLDVDSLNQREDPQKIVSVNYVSTLARSFFVEAQYSERDYIIGRGLGGVRDQILGTLMRRRGTDHRYHAPTFCGSCEDNRHNNVNFFVRGSYFLNTKNAGSHDIVFGYDTFDDITFSVKHQTGSSFTVYSTDILIDAENDIFPVIQPEGAVPPSRNTWVEWSFVPNLDTLAPTSFKTNSFYVNDNWQLSDKWSLSLGVRYDENDGTNSAGAKVADDSKLSPRLGLTYDLKGDGDILIRASYATYVAAIANNRADDTSGSGAISSYRFDYGGPPINTDPSCLLDLDPDTRRPSCVTTEAALRIVFDWYASVGGTFDTPFNIAPDSLLNQEFIDWISIPIDTRQILGTIKSPAADEITIGVSKRLGDKGSIRADVVLREWTDFYSNKLTLDTGAVDTHAGLLDTEVVGNFGNGLLKREYTGLHTQFRYRLNEKARLAVNYSLSKTEGNIDGESSNTGPETLSPLFYPEYRQESWNFPKGDLASDQRHKLRGWIVYDVLDGEHHSLSVSLIQSFFSGSPYGAVGSIETFDLVGDLGYQNAGGTLFSYYFTPRDAFHTDDITATDIALNYSLDLNWKIFDRDVEVFVQPEILNVFNEHAVINVNVDVNELFQTSDPSRPNYLNPFAGTVPVEGVHWQKRPNFGRPENEDDVQRPRTFRFSIGFRF